MHLLLDAEVKAPAFIPETKQSEFGKRADHLLGCCTLISSHPLVVFNTAIRLFSLEERPNFASS